MVKAGLDSIEQAKQNGSWTVLDHVEELIIPKDLEKAFKSKPGSKKHFLGLSKSVRKIYLYGFFLPNAPKPGKRGFLK